MTNKFIESSFNLHLIDEAIEMVDTILESVEIDELENKHVAVDCAHYVELANLLLEMVVRYEGFDLKEHEALMDLRKTYPGSQFGTRTKQ